MTATVRKDVRELVALTINDAAAGTYKTGSYTSSDTWPVHFRRMPASPDRVIVVSCYGLGAPHMLGVQVRVRGLANATVSAEDKAMELKTLLHGLKGLTRGGTEVEQLQHVSTAEMGFDGNGREEIAVNFAATTNDANTALYND